MKNFIVNLTDTPLGPNTIETIKKSYICSSQVVFVDETLELHESSVTLLADTWKVVSTHPEMSDQCDHIIYIMPLNLFALALVQLISLIAGECRARGAKHVLPTYVILQEGNRFTHLN